MDVLLHNLPGNDGEPGFCMLTVEDSGPGIAPEDRSRVFDRFFRASDVTAEPGSGLGLAIVNIIAARHGADIKLDTSSRLGGLKVDVRFPLAKPVPGATSSA